MKPTDEQEKIVGDGYAPGQVVKVIAYAGTGKTSTLELLSRCELRRNPSWKILYLAFNKTVAQEARSRFPANVKAKTIHSIAYGEIGKDYSDQLVGTLRARILASLFRVDVKYIKIGLDTLMSYLSSPEDEISLSHVPDHGDSVQSSDGVKWAEQIWERMIDLSDDDVGMLHDGYLKLFSLSKPQLGYDMIFLDEAQDSNPITTSLVMSQSRSVKVLVGDPHQQIYSWRGAENAMESVSSDTNFHLTKSFRFGESVATIANLILMYYKYQTVPVIGLRNEGEVSFIDSSKPYTVLGRSNSGLFEEALSLQAEGKKVCVVGGADSLKVEQLHDAYRLFTKNEDEVRDQYLKTFTSFSEMEEFGKEYEDVEVKNLCRVIKKHPESFHSKLEKMSSSLVSIKDADVILCTAHKAKGLEWDQVKLLDDFAPLFDESGELLHPSYHDVDEINLIYVAVTRAQKTLQLNGDIRGAIKVILKEMSEQKKEGVS